MKGDERNEDHMMRRNHTRGKSRNARSPPHTGHHTSTLKPHRGRHMKQQSWARHATLTTHAHTGTHTLWSEGCRLKSTVSQSCRWRSTTYPMRRARSLLEVA